ncbi:DUF362 domain-containing protein [Desulfatiglans anilini]|uniref:DUF362 domain-containing protein n=1 Tax=Desulfatiglans anilini TaxID=90728 RepID=UPI00040D873B|nr:DUF362 domain-containing protein [Desulfatiglans anilini]
MFENEITRRTFVKGTLGWAAAGSLGMMIGGWPLRRIYASPYPDVAVAEGPGPKATRAAVKALGGIGRFVKAGDKVVIKPNMSFASSPEEASNTHPDVVKELVGLCLEAGASSVKVLDNTLRPTELCLEKGGFLEACRMMPNTRVEGLKEERFFKEVAVPEGLNLRSTKVMQEVLEADALIAVPVAKSHGATGVTVSMKGMMGLIYERESFHYSMDLNTAIVDLCTVIKPKLVVVDATRILSDGGPYGPGKIIPLNQVIASTDMVAADAMAVQLGTWYGRRIEPRQVKHIRMAHDRGLGNMDIQSQVVKQVSAG